MIVDCYGMLFLDVDDTAMISDLYENWHRRMHSAILQVNDKSKHTMEETVLNGLTAEVTIRWWSVN